MLTKFLDPKNDVAFKRIFGTEKHKNILMEEGFTEGFTEGFAQGFAEGFAQGKVEGKQDTLLEIARQMLNEGIEIKTIIKLTKLSEQDIKALISESRIKF